SSLRGIWPLSWVGSVRLARKRSAVLRSMSPIDFLELVHKHFSSRRRRVWLGNGRAHVELRHGSDEQLRQVSEHLQAMVHELEDVRWVEVHASTRRAVLAFRPGALSAEDLEALVTEAELKAGLGEALFVSS